MKFSVTALALLAAAAVAAPTVTKFDDTQALSIPAINEIDTRQNPAQVIALGILGVATLSAIAAGMTIDSMIKQGTKEWTLVREQFTKGTVENMKAKRNNPKEVAICYNQGYAVSNETLMYERASMELKVNAGLGIKLHTK
ncbi:hypothetical protein BP6252_00017 [Coleophoma cylindrospora]|uniref:DUF7888 domain-containing protein n=1 Tax=Coleophoma cylindrospora TaxID=1849047 RepID=A0A3D8SNU1_9HELO|nr:hypothetical protein BP6252_00017 [Coleophoma cylindrospora]